MSQRSTFSTSLRASLSRYGPIDRARGQFVPILASNRGAWGTQPQTAHHIGKLHPLPLPTAHLVVGFSRNVLPNEAVFECAEMPLSSDLSSNSDIDNLREKPQSTGDTDHTNDRPPREDHECLAIKSQTLSALGSYAGTSQGLGRHHACSVSMAMAFSRNTIEKFLRASSHLVSGFLG